MMASAELVCKKEDDEFGPNALDCIEENLYHGNIIAATNLKIIEEKNICRILTIDIWPLPRKVTDFKNMKIMCVPVTDLPSEDLISYFESAFDFIENGLKEGAVLVHCYQGVSRSAAVILGYLMRKYELNFEKAYEMIKPIRKLVLPNPGFTAQLRLYERMGYKIDRTNMQYKLFRLYIAGDQFRTKKHLPQDYTDVIKSDPSVATIKADPRVYRCKKCRRILARESNIIPHFPRDKFSWRDRRFSSYESSANFCHRLYFIEPMVWMEKINETVRGKLYCPTPNCGVKLGSYCWTFGCLCPCGAKVYPGFYFVPSKVDKDYVQVVEETDE